MEEDDYPSADYQRRRRNKNHGVWKARHRIVDRRQRGGATDKCGKRRSARRKRRQKYCPKVRRIYSYCRGCKKKGSKRKRRRSKSKRRMCCQL